MLSSSLLLLALSAAPAVGSSWKVTVQHTLDTKMTAVVGGQKVSQSDKHSTNVTGKFKVDSVAGDKPDAITLSSAKQGEITVRDDSGVGVVGFKTPVPDQDKEGIPTIKGYLGRLVTSDSDRAAMSACAEGSQAAVEHWMKKTLAGIFLAQAEDVALTQVKVTCAATKTGTRNTVSFDGSVPRGMQSLTLKGVKGTIDVDKSLWATTWKLSGPMSQPGDPQVQMQLSGTFTSRFELGR